MYPEVIKLLDPKMDNSKAEGILTLQANGLVFVNSIYSAGLGGFFLQSKSVEYTKKCKRIY